MAAPLDCDPDVCSRILTLLAESDAPYRSIDHPPLGGRDAAHEAARLRGTPLEMGGKALVLKADGQFVVAAFSAARRMQSRMFRKAMGARRLRFATPDELRELTGLVPGCVPPFGPPVLALPLIADPSLVAHGSVAFTPGLLNRSIVMSAADYQRVARPRFLTFVDSAAG